jgi:osmoprotectant transport system permease protein
VTWGDLAAHTAAYVALAACALAGGCVFGVPLGIVAAHSPPARGPILALANIGRVVPSLALLTFMLPLLGVGFVPAVAALTLLAFAPVAINTDLGFRGVPAAAIDAARGMGMTPTQVVWRVEWPNAFPVLFSGVRTAATEVIASAVLASFIGAGGLGEYVTTGLQANQPQQLWAGVAAIAAIAIFAEFTLAAAGRRIGKTA